MKKLTLVFLVLGACQKGASGPSAQDLIEAGAPLQSELCGAGNVFLQALNDKGVAEAVCAALPIIEAAIPLVIAFADERGDGGACVKVGAHCLTNAERLALIRHILSHRTDAGK